MAHIKEEHANKVCYNIEVKDANSIRHYLSDAHGLWRAEWRVFSRERAPDEEEDID
jgi:phosphoenolpyruvate-protein kinase (PTS system EI component)